MKYFLPDVGRILDLKMMFVIVLMVLFCMMLVLVLLGSVGSNQLVKMSTSSPSSWLVLLVSIGSRQLVGGTMSTPEWIDSSAVHFALLSSLVLHLYLYSAPTLSVLCRFSVNTLLCSAGCFRVLSAVFSHSASDLHTAVPVVGALSCF